MTSGAGKHLVSWQGGSWHLWRTVCVRGAGFPARLVEHLGAPDAARAVDELLAAEVAEEAALASALAALREAGKGATDESTSALRRVRRAVSKSGLPPLDAVDAGGPIDQAVAALRATREATAGARTRAAEATDADRARGRRVIRDAASDPRFLEAVTWQNRQAVESGIAALLRSSIEHDSARDRMHEMMVVNYLQRYCTKNDTIGFFGPWGFADIADDGPAAQVTPGKQMLAARNVYFEQWSVDALAETLAADEATLAWAPPRRLPFVRIVGSPARARSTVTGDRALSRAEELVLAAADGATLPADLFAALLSEHGDVFELESDVEDALRSLVEAQLVAWKLAVPLVFEPDVALRARLARIGDEALRARSVAKLDLLESARARVAAAAGDAAAVGEALAHLETTFTSLTGLPPTRHAGSTYGGRAIVFEDCRRDAVVTLGPAWLDAMGPALELVLSSARWFTHEVGRVYREAFVALHRELAAGDAGAAVCFADFWPRAQRLLFGTKDRPLDGVVAGLEERWQTLLQIPAGARHVDLASTDLVARADTLFAAPGPGWSAARYHSPDLMVAASSLEALNRGELQVVLGELHVAMHTLDQATAVQQHPDRQALIAMIAEDLEVPRFIIVRSKDWPQALVRLLPCLVADKDYWVESNNDEAPGNRSRVLMAADLDVHATGGRLVVRSRDGAVEAEILEVLEMALREVVTQGFSILSRASEHSPRVTIDRLVVAREAWSFRASELSFVDEKEPGARFVAARRWALAHGLPRFVFAKTAGEVKPFYVDLESPALLDVFARVVRKAEEHAAGEQRIALSEMLPRLDQAWLPDASGDVFTCELRCFALDPKKPA